MSWEQSEYTRGLQCMINQNNTGLTKASYPLGVWPSTWLQMACSLVRSQFEKKANAVALTKTK